MIGGVSRPLLPSRRPMRFCRYAAPCADGGQASRRSFLVTFRAPHGANDSVLPLRLVSRLKLVT